MCCGGEGLGSGCMCVHWASGLGWIGPYNVVWE